MKRQTASASGFIKAYALNLLLQFEWLLLAVVFLLLHLFMNFPVYPFWGVFAFWLVLSMIITWFMTWAVGCSDVNPGPGAKRTSERIGETDQKPQNFSA